MNKNIVLFQHLEENIVGFVQSELKRFQKILCPGFPAHLQMQREDGEVVDDEDEEKTNSRDAFLTITLYILRRMNQKELADSLQNSKRNFIEIYCTLKGKVFYYYCIVCKMHYTCSDKIYSR